MFEYINWPILILVTFIFIIILIAESNSKKRSFGIYILISLTLISIFVAAMKEASDVEENIDSFKAGKVLKCLSGGSAYSQGEYYKVSNEDGWKLYKEEFVKDSLVVGPNRCEEW